MSLPNTSSNTIYSHVGHFDQILETRRCFGKTEGAVYGTRSPTAKYTLIDKKPDPGIIEFVGSAAALFRPHRPDGLIFGLGKRYIGRQYKAKMGDVVFDAPISLVGPKHLLVAHAHIAPHSRALWWLGAIRWFTRVLLDTALIWAPLIIWLFGWFDAITIWAAAFMLDGFWATLYKAIVLGILPLALFWLVWWYFENDIHAFLRQKFQQ